TLPAGASLDIHFHADMSNGELTFGIDGWPLKVEGGVLYPPQPLPPVTLPADVDARIVVQTSVSAPAGEVWLNGSRVAT
ncbi:hypothetical protein, partial [Enterococcus faecalis]|uniref:hypothetical protein n=1 Tax=Enterococcus faecalis TaxID=1351 RepID=UPI00403F6B46